MTLLRINLTGDYGLAAQGVVFDPITATIGAVSAFAAANASAIGIAGTIATLAGGALSAGATLAGGNAQKANADYQAAQQRQAGIQALAGSQRQMFDAQRKTDLTLSTLQSRAAASGAGANDPTVVKLGSDIAGRGEEQALIDLSNGLNAKIGADDSALAKEASGTAAVQGSQLSAAGTVIGSVGQGFARYAPTNPYAASQAAEGVPITQAPVGGWP